MRRIGLVAGCSHSAGSEIDGDQDSEYNRQRAYGSLLVESMGYEVVNIAICGSTNSGIARSVLRWFNEEYDPLTMEVFVCIGWTESSRLDVPAQDRPGDYHSGNPNIHWYDSSANSFYRINFGWEGHTAYEKTMIPKYQQFMADNLLLLENWSAKDVLMTQYYLNSLNVPYVMCSTMHMFQPEEHFTSYLVDLIDKTRYYQVNADDDASFYWKYKNAGYVNEKAKYWHHGEEPHKLYATELYDFIKENQDV